MTSPLDQASRIADELLFPAAGAVDAADRVPDTHFAALASAGLYGLRDGLAPVTETLAGGCLATAFVWIQHHRCLREVRESTEAGIAARWSNRLAVGELRGGIALAGLRPGPAPLRCRETPDGFVLDGEAQWITGWGMVDVLLVAARDEADQVRFLLMDAVPAAGLTVTARDISAVRASGTVNVACAGFVVPLDRLVATQPFTEWAAEDAAGSRLNGSLALGVAARCVRLLGPSPLDDELVAVRELLAEGPIAAARAAASELAWRAAGALSARTGARAVLRGSDAERSAREAAFLLVFGNRAAIRDELLSRFSAL